MNPMSLSTPFAILLGALICRLIAKRILKKKDGPFPPGPKPKFLIGNALDLPATKGGQTYLEWEKRYNSNILYMNILGQHMIILNSWEDANEILENRARNYSDRSVVPTLDMIGWDYNLALYQYGDKWRAHRRICQQNFNAVSARQYWPVLSRKIHELLHGFLDSPERFEEHNRMLSISLPLTTMYGYEVKRLDDPAVLAAERGIEIGVQVFSPGGSWANIFPILKHVPWTWTQKMAKEAKEATRTMKEIPLARLKKDMADGVAIPSLVGNFLEKKQTVGASLEEEIAIFNVANTTYGAASETTLFTTLGFLSLIATHPVVQAKAQAELDLVLGNAGRLPVFEDKDSIPYISAIYREVMRLCATLPLAVPHQSVEDDWYKGYFIPKGTMVFGNIWAMNRDENKYEDPMAFKPERFLNPDGTLNDDDRVLAYGFGRRVCVGKHVASTTLWLTFASILACFKITKKKDANGREIEISDEMHDIGLLSHKVSFQCNITPRSDAWRNLIQQTRA